MHALVVLCLALVVSTSSTAQNAYTSDANSCDLGQKTKLADLCPSGFGLPEYGSTQDIINRNPNNAGMIVQAANEYGVNPRLALAVSAHEGAMSACAGSFSGVRGPMQLTQGTARGYGMNRDGLSDNIRGGMATLRDAIRSCGGDHNIRCLADRYNGSTENQRRNWTNDVTRRVAGLQTASIPQGCNGNPAACLGPGDFPTPGTNPSQVAGGPRSSAGGAQIAAIAPPPAATDIVVGSRMATYPPSSLLTPG